MPFGIVDIPSKAHPSGTVTLDDEVAPHHTDHSGIKHDGNIVLVPQPTRDPRDPLTWSLTRRTWVCCVILLGTVVNCAVVVSIQKQSDQY